MLSSTDILPCGSWDPADATDRVVLDHDQRHRRRLRHVGERGTEFLLDLPRASVLRDGDGIKLEDGRIVAVAAAPERLLDIHAHDPATLLRLAWHIGNRHLPAELKPDRIRIREDHVLQHMLEGLGAHVQLVSAPFDPEGGAYESHGHSHAHEDGQP
ncbi:MAG: UreE urease accessory protein [Rhodospirillales bacterium]|jgi:urease accessory protein|nr:UreE urease accessory protein [Rhodospirillales bacterium]